MKLHVYKNNQLLDEVDLTDEIVGVEDQHTSFFIGRDKSCHLVIDDIMVSREHAELIYEKGRWVLKSITNANSISILLNGAVVNENELKNGDVIGIGLFQIIISDIAQGIEESTGTINDLSSVSKEDESIEKEADEKEGEIEIEGKKEGKRRKRKRRRRKGSRNDRFRNGRFY